MADELLAHSAPAPERTPQLYADHIGEVIAGARAHAAETVRYQRDPSIGAQITAAVADAATFHDLGKLDPAIQGALRQGRNARLAWDHIDAGVAHLRACRAGMAAWIVRAHHAPGLPSQPEHFPSRLTKDKSNFRKLRGIRRDDGTTPERHREQIQRTDDLLSAMLKAHESVLLPHQPAAGQALHGLALRLGLSCLVDADYADTANFDSGWRPPEAPKTRWCERLAALDTYVDGLGPSPGERDELRRRFYNACRNREPDQAMIACEGPVGIGKTTAVIAYLLRRALVTNARRLFIVAPYTAILSQTAKRLRKALVLPDESERADAIVAEHHHRADFGDISSRDLATLWSAPIVLTTAVQFFETLSSNIPSSLRKLHALPGSVIFLDEAHAALPTHLWSQNWRWLRELADDWSCSFVLSSGSLARFWETEDVVGDARLKLQDLVPAQLVQPLRKAEAARVRFVTERKRFEGPEPLAEAVMSSPGPRLLIMNTVQSAAVMARHMRDKGHNVLHISTALCPRDREKLLKIIEDRLIPESGRPPDWTLVATSVMETGIDFSFRTPFRERFATTSLIQISGRGNRNFEWSEGVTVHDFLVDHVDGLKQHPAATASADVLAELFDERRLDGEIDAADIVTLAMRREMKRRGAVMSNLLVSAEKDRRYPDVADLGRVITADTRLVVVDPLLRNRIVAHERMSAREILAGSVQIWANKITTFGLESLPGRGELFWWPHAYDADFLGYMKGVLDLDRFLQGDAFIV